MRIRRGAGPQGGGAAVTVLDEERCRILVEKLCSSLGLTVSSAPAVRYVLFDETGLRWIAFGQSMAEIVGSLCDPSWSRIVGPRALPACLQGCASPEELELKAEVAL